MQDSTLPFDKGMIVIGLAEEAPVIPRILHWTSDTVWLGDVSFALPLRVEEEGDPKEDRLADEPRQARARYARAPWMQDRKEFEGLVRSGQLAVTKLIEPEHWRRQTAHHDGNVDDDAMLPAPLRLRRDYDAWFKCEKQRWSRIAPLAADYDNDIGRILEDGVYGSWAAVRTRELGLKSTRAIRDLLHRFLIGLGRHAVMPAYQYRGAPGKPRFLKGWESAEIAEGMEGGSRAAPYLTDARDRQLLHTLYGRHVKSGVSHEQAYKLAMKDGWSQSIEYLPNGDVSVVPKERCPSIQEFIRWGQTALDGSTRKEQDQRKMGLRNPIRLRGSERLPTGPRIGLLSQIDSTSCDQIPVSESWRGKLLPSQWATRLVEPGIGYTYGVYVGFEAPSALTALLTILNAAEDKIEFCDRYGIELKSRDDWISMVGTKIKGDWGEPSAREFQTAIEDIEGSIIYAPSYFPEGKAAVESEHHSMHRRYEHRLAGSTQGRRAQRGERDPAKDACLTPFEFMRDFIRETLRFNNQAYAPPEFLEMVKDGVGPTRKEQILWCREKGYAASGFGSIDSLRIRCLPKMKASIGVDGIHIFDPTTKRDVLLDLVYYSRELGGAEDRPKDRYVSRERTHCWVRIDPSTVGHVWLDGRDLIKVPLNTRDPLLPRLSWGDVLTIAHDKKLAQYFYRMKHFAREVSDAATTQHRNAAARKLRDAQLKDSPPPSPQGAKPATKRSNRDEEIGFMPTEPLVLHDAQTHRPRLVVVGASLPDFGQAHDPFDNLMEKIRSAR